MQVDEVEDTDFGGGYSDQSSHGYEGVVAPDSPPTPEVKKKNEKTLPTHKEKRISGAGGGKKMIPCQVVWSIVLVLLRMLRRICPIIAPVLAEVQRKMMI